MTIAIGAGTATAHADDAPAPPQPVTADSIPYAEPPGAPATAMAPDPNGCYGQDVYGGWWPCYYVFPDFCLNGISGAYFFGPCDQPGTLPNLQAWCEVPFHITHPNCAGIELPRTGSKPTIAALAAGLTMLGLLTVLVARRKRPAITS